MGLGSTLAPFGPWRGCQGPQGPSWAKAPALLGLGVGLAWALRVLGAGEAPQGCGLGCRTRIYSDPPALSLDSACSLVASATRLGGAFVSGVRSYNF